MVGIQQRLIPSCGQSVCDPWKVKGKVKRVQFGQAQ